MQPGVEVPVEHITSREWALLTVGVWWHWFLRWIITVEYGPARLAVLRERSAQPIL